MGSVFVTAALRHLVMLNYEVEPAILAPLVPKGTELDDWHGKTFLSLVAFSFNDIRLKGIAIPLERDFVQINLRFYVRAKGREGWQRGVVFVREVVPRRTIALVGRWLYHGNFVVCPTRSRQDHDPDRGQHRALYSWQHRGAWLTVGVEYAGEPAPPGPGSKEEFIVERYRGYATRRDGSTAAYQVEHPRWKIWPATRTLTDGDFTGFYGGQFGAVFAGQPGSVFVAEGSPVALHPPSELHPAV